MSVVGIDFGTLNSYIAVARNRGVDVICNEVSSRSTSSTVSFTSTKRVIGELAKSLELSNFKNTFTNLKRLLGHDYLLNAFLKNNNINSVQEYIESNQELKAELDFFNSELAVLENENNQSVLGIKTQFYNNETHEFSVIQLVAMYFTKLKQIVEVETKNQLGYCVVNCPLYYSEYEKKQLLAALKIANINCVKLITDTSAVALQYGITKSPELKVAENTNKSESRNVIIIDIGHSAMQVVAATFYRDRMETKGLAYDKHLGGRYVDLLMTKYFEAKIKEKYKTELNKKQRLRLMQACEKAKKVLSTNNQASINVECLVNNEIDISFMINRDEFDEIIQELTERIASPLMKIIDQCQWGINEIHSVELVGGSVRVNKFKLKIQEMFNNEIKLSYTLNQDEAVSRGCALQCALISPVFKVRPYTVNDLLMYNIEFEYCDDNNNSTKTIEIYNTKSSIPTLKQITFNRNADFEIEIKYQNNSKTLPKNLSNLLKNGNNHNDQILTISKYRIKLNMNQFKDKNIITDSSNNVPAVKVKSKLDINGLCTIYSAYIEEKIITIIKEEQDNNKPDEPKKDDNNKEESNNNESKDKEKVTIKRHELKIEKLYDNYSMEDKVLSNLVEKENEMIVSDKLAEDTEIARNELEELVYDIRSKLNSTYSDYETDGMKQKYMEELDKIENWIYDEGDNQTKGVYTEKINHIKNMVKDVVERFKAYEKIFQEIKDITAFFNSTYNSNIESINNNERYSHLTQEEKQAVVEKTQELRQFISSLEDQTLNNTKIDRTVSPSQQINKKYLDYNNTYKPKPKPQQPEQKPNQEESNEDTNEKPKETDTNNNMDID